jgi:hypothetical protein
MKRVVIILAIATLEIAVIAEPSEARPQNYRSLHPRHSRVYRSRYQPVSFTWWSNKPQKPHTAQPYIFAERSTAQPPKVLRQVPTRKAFTPRQIATQQRAAFLIAEGISDRFPIIK